MSKQYENDAVAGWAAAERPDDAEAVRTVNSALHLVAAVEPELDETLAGSGLTRPSFRVLAALRAAPERRLSQRELSAAVRRTSGTISVRIARLEHARLITREPDPDDRRGVIVTLTDRGARRVEGALPAYAEVCEVATRLLHVVCAHRAHTVSRPDQGKAHHSTCGAPLGALHT